MLSKTAPKSNLTVQIRFSASTALCNSALLSHLYSVLYSDLLGPKSASKPTKEHCQNTFSSIPYLRQLPAPVHFLSGWVGAGTKLKDQCPRPRAQSDFYTCKISERIFEDFRFLWLPWVFAVGFARAWGIDSFSENNADFQNNFSWTGGITLFRKTLFRWCHVKKW